jgi:hypothetical protein
VLRNYVKELGKDIDPITVELYGETYTLGADNVELGTGGDNSKCVYIWFDLSTKLLDDQEEPEDYEGPMLTCINFYKDKNNVWSFDIDGLTIPNRRVATKVLKLVKDWAKTIEDREITVEIEKLTTNDLYED